MLSGNALSSGGVFKEILNWTVTWWGQRRRWMYNRWMVGVRCGRWATDRPDSSSGRPLTAKFRRPANKLQKKPNLLFEFIVEHSFQLTHN